MAINPNLVSVPAQSKNLDTATTTTTAGLVHRQVISLADPETATNYARVSGGSLQVSVQNASIAVTAASLPLPTGAATESTLAALNNKFNTNSFSNINTNTTTTIKSGAGVLKRIVVNKVGASSNTCTIYDNTTATGTIIGTIDPVHTQMVFEYDLAFSTGLTIVTANGTAADITVIYK